MIRSMQVEDASAVTGIIASSLGYDCVSSVVRERIAQLADDDHYITLVSVDESTGRVQGLLHAVRYDTLHRLGGWDVISLAVSPDLQGQGVGTQLLRALEEQVLARGGSYVRLNSRVKREAAHRFYESRGYTCDKLQKRFIKELDA